MQAASERPAGFTDRAIGSFSLLQLLNISSFGICMLLNALCNMPGKSITGATNSESK